MKIKNKYIWIVSISLVLLLITMGLIWSSDALALDDSPGQHLSPGFTYQGYLAEGGKPVEGEYNFSFEIFDAEADGESLGYLEVTSVKISSGYFTVLLEFEPEIFAGEDRWLEIGVDPEGGGEYLILDERQKLTPAPYAFYAQNSGALEGRPSSYFQARVSSSCAEGSAIRSIGVNGSVSCDPSPNHPPMAILQANPSKLYLGETISGTVSLSMTLSYDPEGGPLLYYFDHTGEEQGLPPEYYGPGTSTVHYDKTGDYLAAGWVKDSIGDYARAQAMVSVYRFGSTRVVSEMGNGWTSVAEVSGRPAIVYVDPDTSDPMYVRALNADGTAWGTPVVADDSNYVAGSNVSMAVVDGHPTIAFVTAGGSVIYVRALDAAGTSWGTPVTVGTANSYDGFVFTSLVVVDGRPAIAYMGGIDWDLMYVRASNASGSSWGTPVTVDSVGEVGNFLSMAIVDGYPAISYFDDDGWDLKYIRALDSVGNYWGAPVTVESSGDVGLFTSLAVVDGQPAIAYLEMPGTLKFARANDATGASWGTPLTLESSVSVGFSLSMIVVDGSPHVAYYDVTNKNLNYMVSMDASGSSWGTPFVIDSTGRAGDFLSMAIVDGRPAIAYGYFEENLRFTIPQQD